MRWTATVFYRTGNGSVDVVHDFEEIEDLAELVERGPDWNTIEKIEIRLARITSPGMTIEGAEK